MSQITKKEIEAFLALEERRKELGRQATALGKEADIFKARARALIESDGGKGRSVAKSGYVLAMQTKAGTVGWKSAYIDVAGEEAAARLVAECPPVEFLAVAKAA